MGFAQWFWRLFLVFAGLVVAYVLAITLMVQQSAAGANFPYMPVWLLAGGTMGVGASAIWYCVRRIVEPLAELSRHVRATTTESGSSPVALAGGDELGVLTGAFDQMQRDLARRLEQIQDHSQRLQTVLSSMIEGVLAIG